MNDDSMLHVGLHSFVRAKEEKYLNAERRASEFFGRDVKIYLDNSRENADEYEDYIVNPDGSRNFIYLDNEFPNDSEDEIFGYILIMFQTKIFLRASKLFGRNIMIFIPKDGMTANDFGIDAKRGYKLDAPGSPDERVDIVLVKDMIVNKSDDEILNNISKILNKAFPVIDDRDVSEVESHVSMLLLGKKGKDMFRRRKNNG